MTSFNHDFTISNSCLSGNNHALPQHLHNPVKLLSIRRVYFHSNAANNLAKPPCLIRFCLCTECACADWPRSARVSSIHARSISPVEMPSSMFTPPVNASTHVCAYQRDNFKNSKCCGKINNEAGICFQQASSCRSVANDAGKEAWQLECCGRLT